MTEVDLHKAETLAPYIGQDFLTWLWFVCEVRGGSLRSASGEEVMISMTQRVAVQGGEGETKDTATSAGPHSQLQEARLGLRTGKKVQQARLRVEQDEAAWQLQLRAEDFALSGVKTPKVEMALEEGDDPDARFLEKMYLIDKALEVLDAAFSRFLQLRLSPDWSQEVKAVQEWIYA